MLPSHTLKFSSSDVVVNRSDGVSFDDTLVD